jgi:CHAT domain-containing protein/tetratricopeptide (TPR) repeat protein
MKRYAFIFSLGLFVGTGTSVYCQGLRAHAVADSLLVGHGIIVESVTKGTQAERLGLQPGDKLLSWSRGRDGKSFDSPFDLIYVSVEQASRGLVAVHGRRGEKERIWLFGSDDWGIESRPVLVGRYLTLYSEGLALATAGKSIEAAERWNTAAATARKEDNFWLAAWFQYRAGRILSTAQEWKSADEAFAAGLEVAVAAGPIVAAELSRQWARSFYYRGELLQAAKHFHEQLLESEKLGRETMAVANSLLVLAGVDLERGELDQAEAYLTRAFAIAKRLAPLSFQTAAILEDLGILFQDRGDPGKAEEYYLKALPIEERSLSGSRLLANTLTNLGTLAHERGDLPRAEAYHRRALSIAETQAQNELQIAEILSNLGECVLEQGDAATAEQYQKRGLAMKERVAPGSLASIPNLASLGKIARIRKDFEVAEDYYKQALAIAAKVDAPPLILGQLLVGDAEVLRDRRDFEKSAESYRRAVTIFEKSAPGSLDHAEALAGLAGVLGHQGKVDTAVRLYRQALTALEQKAFHLGGEEEDRSRYRAWYVRYYEGYVDALMRLGQREQAFEVVEGSRARTLVEMLSQARINVRQGADAEILKEDRRLHRLVEAKSEARIRLATSEHTEEQLSLMDREIDDLLAQEQDVKAELRASSPGYAALTEPRQLSTAEIQGLLDDDTLLLEYSLGDDKSYVWALSPSSVMAFDLPGRAEIESLGRRVYGLLSFRNQKAAQFDERNWQKVEKDYQNAAAALSEMVIGPVASLLGTKRLLVVSDGVLQYIPFSALPAPEKSGRPAPLLVSHEIVNLPSASVLAEIRRQQIGRRKPPKLVAVLADPVFDVKDLRVKAGTGATVLPKLVAQRDGDVSRSASDLGLTRAGRLYLNRLIYSRNEAAAVIAVMPAGKSLEALDFDASRATAVSGVLAQYRVVHFATHGLLNNKHPELSGLVLSLVDKEGKRQNGFLKLQDIYELKLPVDLVVLSGCETGLGQEISGEGLIGLTRGFMYAGASRVVASLWSVSDAATASLMADFYKAMEQGRMRPAAALREAQIHMWRQGQWSAPYYWAAFQMQGEWQ